EEDDADVDAAGHVGQEFVDEVFDGRRGQANAVALRAGGQIGLLAGDVKIADLVFDGEAYYVGVVHHPLAVVAQGPYHLGDGMADAAGNRSIGHAMVVRVLVDDGRNQEGREEFEGDVLRIADAHITA